jgi:hypothetical protein
VNDTEHGCRRTRDEVENRQRNPEDPPRECDLEARVQCAGVVCRQRARVLDSLSITGKRHAAVAVSLPLTTTLSGQSSKAGRPVAVGDQDGIYPLPAEIDATWEHDVTQIGIADGRPHIRYGSATPSKPTSRETPKKATTTRPDSLTRDSGD